MGIFEKLAAKEQEFKENGIAIPKLGDWVSVSKCDQEEYKNKKLAVKAKKVLDEIPNRRINQFVANTQKQIDAKHMAVEYAKNPEGSIAFLGRPGTGKTHLAIGIQRKLLNDMKYVPYVQYNTMIRELMACRFDEINFNKVLARYTSPKLIMLDDFLKGAVRSYSYGQKIEDREHELIFEVMNKRYVEHKHMIITSEYTIEKLTEFDEAIASRIYEMCGKRVAEFGPEEENWRMKK